MKTVKRTFRHKLQRLFQRLANKLDENHEHWVNSQAGAAFTILRARRAVEIWNQQRNGVWNDTAFSVAMEDLERAVNTCKA